MTSLARRAFRPFDYLDGFFNPIDDVIEQAFRSPRQPQMSYISHDEEDGMHIDVALPGATNDNVDVSVDEGVLIVKCSANVESKNRFASAAREYRWSLDETYDIDKIDAKLEHGVLQLVLPRLMKSTRRVIDVKVT